MVTKVAHRYMQFAPELYPAKDFKFIPTSSLGIIAREYEVTQLVQLLQTMKQDSPMYPMLIESIIENMNISNREELIARLQQSQQPNPQAQQAQQMQMQVALAKEQATAAALQAQAAEAQARAEKYKAETSLTQYEAETDRIKAVSNNLQEGNADDKEFERRFRIAELMLKEKSMNKGEQQNANPNGNQANFGSDQRGFQQTGEANSGFGGFPQ